ENAGINAPIGTLSTSDIDAGNTFTYALVDGVGDDDNPAFAILGSTLLAFYSFYFEARSSYTVRIRSTDQGGLFTEKVFVITVTDSNETPTDIGLSNVLIAENAGPNATVGTLSSVDPDAGNTFSYSLVAGAGSTDNGAFSISGNTLRASNSFDFETNSSYTVRIRATDQGGLFTEKAFAIAVVNVNETPTNIGLSNTSILENAGVDATVGSFTTTDADAGDTFTYSLVTGAGDGDNGAFNISGNTLRATSGFDFEGKSLYTVRVRSTDQGGLFTEKSFIITVVDANEAPTNIGLSSASVPENAGINAPIGTLSTSDIDAGNTFTYALVDGVGDDDNPAFAILGSTLL
ncbi:MAG: cadherin repeat domain-containing protein, partial [Planctomycetota bacterium]